MNEQPGFEQGDLQAIALGCSSGRVLHELMNNQYRNRLLILRNILLQIRKRPEDCIHLLEPDVAWEHLIALQDSAPEVVKQVLSCPQVGLWANALLRSLAGEVERESTLTNAPLWAQIGHLHAIAGTAHLIFGDEFVVTVPTRNGEVALPSLGVAILPGAERQNGWSMATVSYVGGVTKVVLDGEEVRLPDDLTSRTDCWRPVWHLPDSEVCIDDVDWYRVAPKGMTLAMLTDDDAATWKQRFQDARALLAVNHRDMALEIEQGLTSLIPVDETDGWRTRSATSSSAFGAAFLSKPASADAMAVTLVHEFGHSKLDALMECTTLFDERDTSTHYAPWRDDPRPLAGLFHGVFSFAAVTQYNYIQSLVTTGHAKDVAQFEARFWCQQTLRSSASARASGAINENGLAILDELERRLQEIALAEIPQNFDSAVRDFAVDHQAAWRMHHVVPNPVAIEHLVTCWETGTEIADVVIELPSVLEANATAYLLSSRAHLFRRRLSDPEGFAELAERAHRSGVTIDGATSADFDFVDGDYEAAEKRFADILVTDPENISALIGSVLAAEHENSAQYLRLPELSLGLYRELRKRYDDSERPPIGLRPICEHSAQHPQRPCRAALVEGAGLDISWSGDACRRALLAPLFIDVVKWLNRRR